MHSWLTTFCNCSLDEHILASFCALTLLVEMTLNMLSGTLYCKFVDPKLANVAEGRKARWRHLTTEGQQICMMLRHNLFCYIMN